MPPIFTFLHLIAVTRNPKQMVHIISHAVSTLNCVGTSVSEKERGIVCYSCGLKYGTMLSCRRANWVQSYRCVETRQKCCAIWREMELANHNAVRGLGLCKWTSQAPASLFVNTRVRWSAAGSRELRQFNGCVLAPLQQDELLLTYLLLV